MQTETVKLVFPCDTEGCHGSVDTQVPLHVMEVVEVSCGGCGATYFARAQVFREKKPAKATVVRVDGREV